MVVTNALHFLPECDKVYVIDNKTTAECGTYQQLINSRSNFSSILRDYSNVKEEKSEENDNMVEAWFQNFIKSLAKSQPNSLLPNI